MRPLRTLTLVQDQQLTFGSGCMKEGLESYLLSHSFRTIYIVAARSSRALVEDLASHLRLEGRDVFCDYSCTKEPTTAVFEASRKQAVIFGAECVVGFGGGSVLDLAKLVAALAGSAERIENAFGISLLQKRMLPLVCVPTTSGTGSEVSPNAILLDETDHMKKGVISRFLVPDAAFVDPVLTMSLPPRVTAFTGIDALTHCIEAYTNKFAHPLVDMYALEGIRLIAKYLRRAVRKGDDLEAREGMAMASMLGGLCLGPVNTAAVHALAYPLGADYGVAHGLANAILLPEVFRFNRSASPSRHAEVAVALGVPNDSDDLNLSERGADLLQSMLEDVGICSLPDGLSSEPSALQGMAESASKITRLLNNNPQSLWIEDMVGIYRRSFSKLRS